MRTSACTDASFRAFSTLAGCGIQDDARCQRILISYCLLRRVVLPTWVSVACFAICLVPVLCFAPSLRLVSLSAHNLLYPCAPLPKACLLPKNKVGAQAEGAITLGDNAFVPILLCQDWFGAKTAFGPTLLLGHHCCQAGTAVGPALLSG